MSTETTLLVIVALLILIFAVLLLLVRWMSSFMSGMHELIAERLEKPNADLDRLLKKRNFSKVISEVTEKRLANSDDPTLYWYKGLAHFHLNQMSEARTMLEHAIDLEPSYEKELLPYLKRLDSPES